MTSEPDSTPRRRPPTIDMTAKEVDTAPGASAQEPGAAEQAKDSAARGGRRTGLGGVMPYVAGAPPAPVVAALCCRDLDCRVQLRA